MSYAMKITSLLLFTFCIAISTEAKSETECEIFYEVYPHKDAAYLIGRGLYDEFNKLSWDDKKALSISESNRLKSIMTLSPDLANKVRLKEVLITQGGYEGVSSISINLPLTMAAGSVSADIISLASMIGYIYYQDSVLLSCSDDIDENMKTARLHTLSDAGEMDYLKPMSARLLFGMMMGVLNRVEYVGYTYDASKNQFRALDFDTQNDKKRKALLKITQHLKEITGGKVRLNIDSTDIYAYSARNKWRHFPSGGDYINRLTKSVDTTLLKKQQMAYINRLKTAIRNN